MVLCILYTIPKIPQGYYRFLLCILYKEALYILYPNSTRVLCLMYPIKWPYVFCTPKFHKGTIIILCILIRGFRCILYPKFQRVLRYLMYPMRLYVFCTCLYPKFHKGTYLASKIPTSWCLLHIIYVCTKHPHSQWRVYVCWYERQPGVHALAWTPGAGKAWTHFPPPALCYIFSLSHSQA